MSWPFIDYFNFIRRRTLNKIIGKLRNFQTNNILDSSSIQNVSIWTKISYVKALGRSDE